MVKRITYFKDSRYCWCPFNLRRQLRNPFIYGPTRNNDDFNWFLNLMETVPTKSKMKEVNTLTSFKSSGSPYQSLGCSPTDNMPIEVLHTILLGVMKYLAFELLR